VTRQISGPSIKGGSLPAVTEGNGLVIPPGTANVNSDEVMPPRVPGLNGEQVTDFAQDLQEGNIPRIHQPDASDVLSTRYDTSGTGNSLAIAATMRVSDLSVIPGQTTWQMSFAVNAPHNVMSPNGTYSFGASDHADQFYLEADTDVSGSMTYSYGTVQRANDGKLIYTMVGAADAGAGLGHRAAGALCARVPRLRRLSRRLRAVAGRRAVGGTPMSSRAIDWARRAASTSPSAAATIDPFIRMCHE